MEEHGVALAKDPPIIKLERGKEIHLLRSISELKMASSCGYQIVYIFLPYRVGFIAVIHRYGSLCYSLVVTYI